ncbi:unnamed protein product [Rotaria sordida]|uniref:Uncharacterized protein n=1 Tax=Rotaria sordida TaxID=392033 RepID=A0A813YYF0_9BILA|nr:unnamed protein product [Rotaria sordida]CAF1004184.1 unnamed protein product [Rotaria sordida]
MLLDKYSIWIFVQLGSSTLVKFDAQKFSELLILCRAVSIVPVTNISRMNSNVLNIQFWIVSLICCIMRTHILMQVILLFLEDRRLMKIHFSCSDLDHVCWILFSLIWFIYSCLFITIALSPLSTGPFHHFMNVLISEIPLPSIIDVV